MRSPRRSVLDLAPLELDCMNTLWPMGEASVRQIRDQLAGRASARVHHDHDDHGSSRAQGRRRAPEDGQSLCLSAKSERGRGAHAGIGSSRGRVLRRLHGSAALADGGRELGAASCRNPQAVSAVHEGPELCRPLKPEVVSREESVQQDFPVILVFPPLN